MLYTIHPAEMKRVEQHMMEITDTPALLLMERAATHVADVAACYLKPGQRLLVLCGAGNNGGDGLAAARILLERMPTLTAVIWQCPGTLTPETQVQQTRLSPYGERLIILRVDEKTGALDAGSFHCAIDALFGTGLSRPLDGVALRAVQALNTAQIPVIAVDIPSGLDGQTGYPPTGATDAVVVQATDTVTFHRLKPGLLLGDGPDCCGHVHVADIGITAELDDATGLAVLHAGDVLLPARKRNSHKGDYGRVLVIAGSFGMAGAAALCATAALRAGAGLVTVACTESIVATVQQLCPCATCLLLPSDAQAAWRLLLPALQKADALAVGCGLGQSASARHLVQNLLLWLQNNPTPAVLDADALNLLTALTADDHSAALLPLPDTVVLTPHMGEAARMLGISSAEAIADQVQTAQALRKRYGTSIVLKSASSVLTAADGDAIHPFGTPAMAKGGSGDTLAGVIAAVLAGQSAYGLQGIRLLQSACALHGLAGELAAQHTGERGMLATDLCAMLGHVPQNVPSSRITTLALSPAVALPREAPPAKAEAMTYDASTVSLYQPSAELASLTASPTHAEPHDSLRAAKAALGRHVRVTVDRPLGSQHPEHRDLRYELNYGYVADVLAADNEWQDAYLYGIDKPIEVFEGEVVAVIHRLNDVEDKWIVASPGTRLSSAEVRSCTHFAEQFFESQIWVL